MQSADEGVVELRPLGGEFAEAEDNLSIGADAQKRSLAGGAAVGSAPDASAEFEIPKRHGGGGSLLAVALVHRAGHKGQGPPVGEGVLLPVPSLQQVELHGAWIDVEAEGFGIGGVAEGPGGIAPGFGFLGSGGRGRGLAILVQGGSDRHQGSYGSQGQEQRPQALAGAFPPTRAGLQRLGESLFLRLRGLGCRSAARSFRGLGRKYGYQGLVPASARLGG